MANVIITLDFDLDGGDPEVISSLLDDLVAAVQEHNDGVEPMIALEVGGEHRDPDDPGSGL